MNPLSEPRFWAAPQSAKEAGLRRNSTSAAAAGFAGKKQGFQLSKKNVQKPNFFFSGPEYYIPNNPSAGEWRHHLFGPIGAGPRRLGRAAGTNN